MPNSTSILLGAGFSVPKGYPTGNQLNKNILDCDGSEFTYNNYGKLISESKQDYRNPNEEIFDFLRTTIKFYDRNIKPFDYEEFYDYLIDKAYKDKQVADLAKVNLKYSKDVVYLLNNALGIYIQMVGFYLKDKDGNAYYEDAGHFTKPTMCGYTGILNCLEHWGKEGIVNIHTLNHDLFLDRLSKTDWINGEMSDGFQELGSLYYGNLIVNESYYKVRLQFYNEKYDNKFRIFKLHGSRDYVIYYNEEDGVATPEVYLKTRYGIGFGKLYKEVVSKQDNSLMYKDCWFDYYSNFLIGTTSKIQRYKESLLYEKLFEYFKTNLREAKQLIIIGYGAKDKVINEMILEYFDYNNKPSFIIDPYAGDDVINLMSKLGSHLIDKQLDDLKIEEFK